MPTDSIIEHFDPLKDILPGRVSGEIAPMKYELGFQRMKETFHHGIVPAVSPSTHAGGQAVFGEYCTVPRGGVLGPTIGMMHHAACRSSVFNRHGGAAVANS